MSSPLNGISGKGAGAYHLNQTSSKPAIAKKNVNAFDNSNKTTVTASLSGNIDGTNFSRDAVAKMLENAMAPKPRFGMFTHLAKADGTKEQS